MAKNKKAQNTVTTDCGYNKSSNTTSGASDSNARNKAQNKTTNEGNSTKAENRAQNCNY